MYETDNELVGVDDRITLMQQYVDLDNARKAMDKDQKFLAEKQSKLAAEFRQVSERLHTILGFEHPMESAKRSLTEAVGMNR